MHVYAKCDQNIPCGSRVMNIFTRILSSLTVLRDQLYAVACCESPITFFKMLKCISMQNIIKIYHVVQELCAFSLKDIDRPK